MRDPRLDRLADVLVSYSTRVKKGDLVTISADAAAFPAVEAVFERVLRAGGNPVWTPRSDRLLELLLEHASDEQLRFFSPLEMHRVSTADVQIGFWVEQNPRHLGKFDPARIAAQQSSRRDFMKVFMDRAARGALRWVGTIYPTHGNAQDAERSLAQFEDFVFRAGLLHLPDPVAAWRQVHERQQRVCEFLQGKHEVRFTAPPRDGDDGTDLRVDVSRATWVNCAGLENFPDGEVFAGPTGVEGHVCYTYPAVYQGREVDGVRLAFKNGRVSDASARKNEEFLIKMLDLDAGARVLGEIAIGTNYSITEFMKNTLFDEKMGGTFHAAVGAGYPESGNSNESGLHWDMVCDLTRGGAIAADGEVFHRDGKFLRADWPGP
jgi:aminopeptidase